MDSQWNVQFCLYEVFTSNVPGFFLNNWCIPIYRIWSALPFVCIQRLRRHCYIQYKNHTHSWLSLWQHSGFPSCEKVGHLLSWKNKIKCKLLYVSLYNTQPNCVWQKSIKAFDKPCSYYNKGSYQPHLHNSTYYIGFP